VTDLYEKYVTLYTPVFYNASTSDTILSPEAICASSNGILVRWMQCGSASDQTGGSVTFFDEKGAEVLTLQLQKCNGLYYTPINAITTTTDYSRPSRISDVTGYYHTPEGIDDNDVSLDLDCATMDSFDAQSVASAATIAPSPPPFCPTGSPSIALTKLPPLDPKLPKPTAVDHDYISKSKQIEANLWQARLGHCDE
jgi:hypothetical protein